MTIESNRALPGSICLVPALPDDQSFIYEVYASTRMEELISTGWGPEAISAFLKMQHGFQHAQYLQNYPYAEFNIIYFEGIPAGRMYINRCSEKIHIVDISILTEFRGRGIATFFLNKLIEEADSKNFLLSLQVNRNNRILDFYCKLGFTVKDDKGLYLYMEKSPAGGWRSCQSDLYLHEGL